MDIKKIGIIGAGTMGADIAFDLSSYGYPVVVKDIDSGALQRAAEKIRSGFRGFQLIKKELRDLTIDALLANISFTTRYDGFEDLDLIIENIPEDWALKQALYKELGAVGKVGALYAVNTSCISITKVAALLPRPENVIGMHFMNPVPLKATVETVRGVHTSEETVALAKAFLKTLKKSAIVVNDFPGFVSNRLSHLFMNEAAFLVQDQVAEPKDIDRLFKQGYGHQMGPLETADLIGLDTVVNSLNILYESYQDPKFRCCPLLKRMVDAGYHGKKTGRGFYEYNQ